MDTEGLPGLVMETVRWLKEQQLPSEPDDSYRSQLMQAVVRPFVENNLLALERLLPAGVYQAIPADQRSVTQRALAELVLASSVFRIVTHSHLDELAKHQPVLAQAMQHLATIRRPIDLFGSLSIIEPNSELWHSLYDAVRRLYFRHRYASPQDQLLAHREAKAVYGNWLEMIFGSDKVHFLLETLWHEIEITRLSPSVATSEALAQLKRAASELFAKISDEEGAGSTLQGLIAQDEELQRALADMGAENLVEWLTTAGGAA